MNKIMVLISSIIVLIAASFQASASAIPLGAITVYTVTSAGNFLGGAGAGTWTTESGGNLILTDGVANGPPVQAHPGLLSDGIYTFGLYGDGRYVYGAQQYPWYYGYAVSVDFYPGSGLGGLISAYIPFGGSCAINCPAPAETIMGFGGGNGPGHTSATFGGVPVSILGFTFGQSAYDYVGANSPSGSVTLGPNGYSDYIGEVTISVGTPAPVPEPTSLGLLGLGLAGLGFARRRKQKAA